MIKKRKELQDTINVTFDISMVDALIKYIRCGDVARSQITQLYKLMKRIDLHQYEYNPDILDRLKLIKTLCMGICDHDIRDESVLMTYLYEHLDIAEDVLKQVNFEKDQLNPSERNMIYNAINERLQYIYIYEVKDDIVTALSTFDHVGFTSYYDVLNSLKEKLSTLMVKLQTLSAPDSLIRSFNFSGEDCMSIINQVVNKAKKPSSVLMTGIRQLNAILAPGFEASRFYIFIGGSGKFKSGTLLNIADQIRLFNPQVKPIENGRRKTILFVTMENTIYETILRIVDMYNNTGKEIRDMTPEEVERILREEGHFCLEGEEGIDIDFRYYSDMEISTADLYSVIRELENAGKDVIALVLDYILKINSAHEHYGDERIRLSYAGRELATLARDFDIPVITAMQFNREGNGILDAAMMERKEDVLRFVGGAYIGQCWDLIQTADWVGFINPEIQRSTGKKFLSFKKYKLRGKEDPLAVDYFNHPFVHNDSMRLEPDVMKPEPVSVISLASDLVTVSEETEKVPNTSAQQRPKIATFTTNQSAKSILKEIDLDGLLKAS